MKILYLESIAGIAGDMFAASFVHAGLVSVDELQALSEQLGIPGVKIQVSKVIRATIEATHLNVLFDEVEWVKRFSTSHHPHHDESLHFHVPFRALEQIINHSTLSEAIKNLACRILDTLAVAEAHCHGISKEEVAFHELGMVDSLMDIVMAAYCIIKVDPARVVASPVKLGRGIITTAHGTQPVPPPVSAALAVDMPIAAIPAVITRDNIELSTPTGLAIIKTICSTFSKDWPEGALLANGCGAGTMNLEGYPNLFRISVIDSTTQSQTLPFEYDTVIEVSANYDDATPEQLAWATRHLFHSGALDVWQTTAVGKKGRVMIVLSFLAEETAWIQCATFLLIKTSTFGLRYKHVDRLKLKRHFETRVTPEGSFQVKVGCTSEGIKIKEKVEFDDIQKAWDKDVNDSL
ncbi:DUF111 family protein [Legionella sp. MW5194]|uniref:LarC family nickel insertion protein n=1 Tax=Legionella sp. MW5194 TaxID=2662448 RepID=UPI00193D4C6C|nr:LarC family nickel insertion protein [Legionella sp. MW5194]QRN03997.1 DUF111 family protein [Legionella sp. MW5194]